MSLPVHFATLMGGHQALSLFDRQFAAVGALTTIPCNYGSNDGNNIVLTPMDDTPIIRRYTSLAPQFIFLATSNNSGPVTINVMGVPSAEDIGFGAQPPASGWPSPPSLVPLGAWPAFRAGGTQPMTSGDIVANAVYVATFVQALNNGAGAFAVAPYGDSFGIQTQIPKAFWPNWQGWNPTVNSSFGPYGGVTVGGAAFLNFGHMIMFSISLTVTDKGSGGSFMQITLPTDVTGLPAETCVGSGRNTDTGAMGSLIVEEPENWAIYANFDGSDPVAAVGASAFAMTGFYGVV